LLSPDPGSSTYFHNRIEHLKDFEKLAVDSSGYTSELQEILDNLDSFEERKNMFLDHLIARFAENMSDYAFMLLDNHHEDLHSAEIWHKSAILNEYPEMSYRRFQSFDYYGESSESWDTENVAGLKQRLARLLGIREFRRKDLTNYRFEVFEDESGDGWTWHLKNDEDLTWLKSSRLFDDKQQASAAMWNAMMRSGDQTNYRIDKEDGLFVILLERADGTSTAKINNTYSSKEDAEAERDAFSRYMKEKQFEEGFFLFEHILLLPDKKDPKADEKFMHICMDSECTKCPPHDPYSLRLTIVLPGWLKRFSNMYYREFAENLIRTEVPAHILARICWIGYDSELATGEDEPGRPQMAQLQEVYKNWITYKMKNPGEQKNNKYLKDLADTLHNLETIYPQGRLHDCQDDDEQQASIILGRSTIGEIKEEKKNDE
jgi:uncharacterized protein